MQNFLNKFTRLGKLWNFIASWKVMEFEKGVFILSILASGKLPSCKRNFIWTHHNNCNSVWADNKAKNLNSSSILENEAFKPHLLTPKLPHDRSTLKPPNFEITWPWNLHTTHEGGHQDFHTPTIAANSSAEMKLVRRVVAFTRASSSSVMRVWSWSRYSAQAVFVSIIISAAVDLLAATSFSARTRSVLSRSTSVAKQQQWLQCRVILLMLFIHCTTI